MKLKAPNKPETRIMSITEAKKDFLNVVQLVEEGTIVILTRYGKPRVRIVPLDFEDRSIAQ